MLDPLEALIRLHEHSVSSKTNDLDSRAEAEVERCKAELPPEAVEQYEYLLKRYGASAVVPIKNGCCSGCYIQIPSSRQNQLEEGIFICEQCGRLLYDESKVYNLATGL